MATQAVMQNVVFAQTDVRQEDWQEDRLEDRQADRDGRGCYGLTSHTNGVRISILTPFSIRDRSKLAMPPALSIMLLVHDIPRCTILRVVNPDPFALRQDTIGLGVIFHPVDVFLLLVQSIRFS
jgi:hypothetical protein